MIQIKEKAKLIKESSVDYKSIFQELKSLCTSPRFITDFSVGGKYVSDGKLELFKAYKASTGNSWKDPVFLGADVPKDLVKPKVLFYDNKIIFYVEPTASIEAKSCFVEYPSSSIAVNDFRFTKEHTTQGKRTFGYIQLLFKGNDPYSKVFLNYLILEFEIKGA